MKVKTDKCKHSYKEECSFCMDWRVVIPRMVVYALSDGTIKESIDLKEECDSK